MTDENEQARNWAEDFSHENGNYQCLCVECKKIFIGHKRRVICKLCSIKDKPKKILAIG
jgi:hypothetical protein